MSQVKQLIYLVRTAPDTAKYNNMYAGPCKEKKTNNYNQMTKIPI